MPEVLIGGTFYRLYSLACSTARELFCLAATGSSVVVNATSGQQVATSHAHRFNAFGDGVGRGCRAEGEYTGDVSISFGGGQGSTLLGTTQQTTHDHFDHISCEWAVPPSSPSPPALSPPLPSPSSSPSSSPSPSTTRRIDISLNEGWTWFSLNVVPPEMSVAAVFASLSLTGALTGGDHLKNQASFTDYYAGTVGSVVSNAGSALRDLQHW